MHQVNTAQFTNFPLRQTCIVEEYLHGVRIDSFLIRHFRNYTPFRMLRLVEAGQVTVDGEIVHFKRRVVRGEEVTVRLLEPPDKLYIAECMPLAILFEDESLLVVNKPAGMVAHPVGAIQSGTLINAVQHYLDQNCIARGLLRPGIVHRLDRLTSGVMVIAKDHLSHRNLSIQFQQREVNKEYLAIVEGLLPAEQGSIDLPIGRASSENSILMSAKPDARNAKPARTCYRVVERLRSHTLVRLIPETGRIHQLRVHMAEMGFPILGDAFYGPHGAIHSADSPAASRHALHAETIRLQHPVTKQPVEFVANWPDDFQQMYNTCKAE